MTKKTIKVTKNNVVKEIEERLEMDYVKNGWKVVKEYNSTYENPFLQPLNNNYIKK